MFQASGIILHTLQIVCYFNLKILFIKKVNIRYVNTAQWRANAIYEQFILEQNNDTFCKLVNNDDYLFMLLLFCLTLSPTLRLAYSIPLSLNRQYRKPSINTVLISTGPNFG